MRRSRPATPSPAEERPRSARPSALPGDGIQLWTNRDVPVGGLTPYGTVTNCPQAPDRFAPPVCGRTDTVLTRGLTPEPSLTDKANRPLTEAIAAAADMRGCGSLWLRLAVAVGADVDVDVGGRSPRPGTLWPRSARISGGRYLPK